MRDKLRDQGVADELTQLNITKIPRKENSTPGFTLSRV